MTPTIVLASASPRRADVLRQLGLEPVVRPADVDESPLQDETPGDHVERLARAKATAVGSELPDALVLGGDTVVVDRGRILGKPADEADARAMLRGLAGREHEVVSGLALAGPHGLYSTRSLARVRFKALDDAEIDAYVRTGEPLDKAGAYGIQARGAALVAGLEGDYYTIVGFPVAAFVDLLKRAGWRYDFGRVTRLGTT